MNSDVLNSGVGVAVLAWILYRQTQPREVKLDHNSTGMVILGAYGAWLCVAYLKHTSVALLAVTLLALSLIVSAAFGVLRGRLVPLWQDANDVVWRKGNALTIALWVVAVGSHIATDVLAGRLDPHADGLASASLVLYLAVSLAVQRVVVASRARELGVRQPV